MKYAHSLTGPCIFDLYEHLLHFQLPHLTGASTGLRGAINEPMNDAPNPIAATFFAPHLALRDVAMGIAYYQKAFGAVELRRFSNADGSVHVAEMAIAGALFHLHEESPASAELSPLTTQSTTVVIGLFVPDPAAAMQSALAAGGQLKKPLTHYDYGYQQGEVIDPTGHHWLIQKKI